MSIAELHPSESVPDRTPPNDVAAEQSVLGAMLLSKDAIADVVEVLREGLHRALRHVVPSVVVDDGVAANRPLTLIQNWTALIRK